MALLPWECFSVAALSNWAGLAGLVNERQRVFLSSNGT
jgi:hypothetical protein